MRDLILLAKDKASRLSNEELAAEIERLSSDPDAKLRLKDERNNRADLTPLLVSVLKDELAARKAATKGANAAKPGKENQQNAAKERTL